MVDSINLRLYVPFLDAKLDCKFDQTGQSYYTVSHEREEMKIDHSRYIRKSLVSRQPAGERVLWSSLSLKEEASFEQLLQEDPEAGEAQAYKFESDGKVKGLLGFPYRLRRWSLKGYVRHPARGTGPGGWVVQRSLP